MSEIENNLGENLYRYSTFPPVNRATPDDGPSACLLCVSFSSFSRWDKSKIVDCTEFRWEIAFWMKFAIEYDPNVAWWTTFWGSVFSFNQIVVVSCDNMNILKNCDWYETQNARTLYLRSTISWLLLGLNTLNQLNTTKKKFKYKSVHAAKPKLYVYTYIMSLPFGSSAIFVHRKRYFSLASCCCFLRCECLGVHHYRRMYLLYDCVSLLLFRVLLSVCARFFSLSFSVFSVLI